MFVEAAVDVTATLMKEWMRLREAQKKEELATDEWKQLEREYLLHLKWRFQYPKRVLGQQFIYSWLLTLLVIVLVIAGLVFSFIQLKAAIALGDISALKTEIEVATAGKLSMNSSIIGAIVLVISLLFFNLYLKHVFQIKSALPPHVGITDTDAMTVWDRFRSRISKTPRSFGTKASLDPDDAALMAAIEEILRKTEEKKGS